MKRNWPQKSALLFRFLKCTILKCAQLNSIQPMESAQNRLESKDWLDDKPSCSHPPRFLQGCNAPPLTGHCSGAGSGASERCHWGERWWRWLVQVLPPAPVECHGSGACRQRVRNTSQGRLKELLNPFCVLVIRWQAGATHSVRYEIPTWNDLQVLTTHLHS